MKYKKLFVAIPLTQNILHLIDTYITKHHFPGKQTPLENLHITVQFLGNIPVDEIREVIIKTNNIAISTQPFSMYFSGFHLKKGYNQMVWGTFAESPAYRNLTLQFREAFNDIDKRFVPHITITRIRQKVNTFEPPIFDNPVELSVSSVELWESNSGNHGSIYSMVERFPLNLQTP